VLSGARFPVESGAVICLSHYPGSLSGQASDGSTCESTFPATRTTK
jgi:hypothetical protein